MAKKRLQATWSAINEEMKAHFKGGFTNTGAVILYTGTTDGVYPPGGDFQKSNAGKLILVKGESVLHKIEGGKVTGIISLSPGNNYIFELVSLPRQLRGFDHKGFTEKYTYGFADPLSGDRVSAPPRTAAPASTKKEKGLIGKAAERFRDVLNKDKGPKEGKKVKGVKP